MADKTSDIGDIPSIYPQLKQTLTKTSLASTVCSYASGIHRDGPILVLIHGYPQSALIWRDVVPKLIDKVSLFIPELPGYGVSTYTRTSHKKDVGIALLEALEAVFNIPRNNPRRKVILAGHDRGARICHRLAVDKHDFPNLDVVSTVLMDIVPTQVQWAAFANPNASVGYFHWPFLANVDLAARVIDAFGGDRWCRELHKRAQGKNPDGVKRLTAGGAVDVYAANFKNLGTIYGSCEDYASGAAPEVTEQAEDMHKGRKIPIPTLVIYSEAGLGTMHDIPAIWPQWVGSGVDVKLLGIGDGYGHYLPSEAPEEVGDALIDWIKKY